MSFQDQNNCSCTIVYLFRAFLSFYVLVTLCHDAQVSSVKLNLIAFSLLYPGGQSMEGYSVFKRNCKLYFQWLSICGHIVTSNNAIAKSALPFAFSLSRTAQWLLNFKWKGKVHLQLFPCLTSYKPVYLNSNINYHTCFFYSVSCIVTCQKLNRIAYFSFSIWISDALRKPVNQCQVGLILWGVLYWEVTHFYWLVSKRGPSTMIMLNFWQWPCPWS